MKNFGGVRNSAVALQPYPSGRLKQKDIKSKTL